LKAANPAITLPCSLKAGMPWEMDCSASGTIPTMTRCNSRNVDCLGSSNIAR